MAFDQHATVPPEEARELASEIAHDPTAHDVPLIDANVAATFG
jgi:hypothetical protein